MTVCPFAKNEKQTNREKEMQIHQQVVSYITSIQIIF
jgi:hypothetical protein